MSTITSITVLVVDDDKTIRDVLRAMLGFEGCQVVEAPDGNSALKVAADASPDVVILDVTMPGMNGIDVCRMMKSWASPPKVVMLTARDTPEDEMRGLAAGADAYLRKPFSPLEVLKVVGVDVGQELA